MTRGRATHKEDEAPFRSYFGEGIKASAVRLRNLGNPGKPLPIITCKAPPLLILIESVRTRFGRDDQKGEEAMLSHSLNRIARDLAIEQSLDAAIEISDVITGKRSNSPALSNLIHTLMGADDQGVSPSKRDLLTDSQFASISQRAAALSGRHYTSTNELSDILDLLLKVNSVGLTHFSSCQRVDSGARNARRASRLACGGSFQ